MLRNPFVSLAAMLGVAVTLGGLDGQQKIPNDPLFRYQFSFSNPGGAITIPINSYSPRFDTFSATVGMDANLTRAWVLTTGSKAVVVAILDDGFFYEHEDLRDNIWQNPGESGLDGNGLRKETNGVDDDNNGFVDDVVGWDFAFEDPDPDCYVFDGMRKDRIQPYDHSTPVLGIIGAKGNNGIGVAGVNWDVSMMLLKIGAQGISRGEIDTQRKHRAARAIRYAVDNGARVINWSGRVGDKDVAVLSDLQAAFDYAESKGVLIVLAAGNAGRDHDAPGDPVFPQFFKNGNILRVAEVTFQGKLDELSGRDRASSSDYGRASVHLAAIGRNYSTSVRDGRGVYRISGGTSSSAPVVTGVAALVLAVRPDLKAAQVKKILIESATRLPPLESKLISGGIVNAFGAVKLALSYPRK